MLMLWKARDLLVLSLSFGTKVLVSGILYRMFSLMRGDATSSNSTKAAKLIGDVAGNRATKSASGVYSNTGKRFLLTVIKSAAGVRATNSKTEITVGYNQLSQNIQRIQKSGGKILSISEV
jgi:phycoerythrin-associated linker protein